MQNPSEKRAAAPSVTRYFQYFLASILLVAAAQISRATWGAEPPPVSANSSRKTVVVLGDSLAAGYGLEASEAFPFLLQEKIDAAGWNFQVINAGVSGETSAGGLRRIEWLLKRPIDVLLIELGGNDGLRGISPETTRTNLQAIIDKTRMKFPRIQIVIAGMQMPANMGSEYTARFKEVFPDLAKKNDASLISFLLEGVGGREELNLPDRIHPTAEGHKIVAENVWRVLKPLLESMQPNRKEKREGLNLGSLAVNAQKILHDRSAFLRQNAFGMKLHAPNGMLFVPDSHDLSFVGFSGNLQTVRHRIALDHKRMITRRGERIRHPPKKILAVVPDRRGFAMHHPIINNDVRAKRMADALVPQTNPEDRKLRSKCSNDFV
jgi:acyl-CoA thioesterase I